MPGLSERGAAWLVSRKRGRPSNRKLPAAVREHGLGLVRVRHADFGPTLAREKLLEHHGAGVSTETLRQWMMEVGLWVPRAQRLRRAHQPRSRRACLGELVQIDGCAHEWFEDRAPRCTLLVYVDDARSRLMELRFVASECALDDFASTRSYLLRHGQPVAFYSDQASVLRVAASEANKKPGAPRFVREPRSPHDAHRPVRDDEELERIFTWQEERKLSKNLTLHYKRVTHLVESGPETLALAGARCRVHEHADGRIEVFHGGERLSCRVFFAKDPRVTDADIVANKRLAAVLAQSQAHQQERGRQGQPHLTLRQKARIRDSRKRTEVQASTQAAG